MRKAELEQRILVLEAVIQAQYEVVQDFCESCPIPLTAIRQLDHYITVLYESANVREDIGECVEMNVTFRDPDEVQ